MSEAIAVPAEGVAERAPSAVVAARALSRQYGAGDTAVQALRGVDLDVQREKLTAVMGPSGSGKSTLMHLLAGLDKPTAGDVWIDGTNITKLGDNELTKLRRKHIGFIFQFFNLLPMLTAEENVTLPLSIARALVSRPTVMFADEPTGNLDSTTSGEILELLRTMVESYGQTTVMVTHDPHAAAIAHRILFLSDGSVVRDLGPSDASDVIAAMDELSRR